MRGRQPIRVGQPVLGNLQVEVDPARRRGASRRRLQREGRVEGDLIAARDVGQRRGLADQVVRLHVGHRQLRAFGRAAAGRVAHERGRGQAARHRAAAGAEAKDRLDRIVPLAVVAGIGRRSPGRRIGPHHLADGGRVDDAGGERVVALRVDLDVDVERVEDRPEAEPRDDVAPGRVEVVDGLVQKPDGEEPVPPRAPLARSGCPSGTRARSDSQKQVQGAGEHGRRDRWGRPPGCRSCPVATRPRCDLDRAHGRVAPGSSVDVRRISVEGERADEIGVAARLVGR